MKVSLRLFVLVVAPLAAGCFNDDGRQETATAATTSSTNGETTCQETCTAGPTSDDTTTSGGETTAVATTATTQVTTDATTGAPGECGDGVCQPPDESSEDCPEDCYCGNDSCESNEDPQLCPEDCGPPYASSDWISQDYVLADPSQDPYCVPHAERAEQDLWTPVRYLRRDADLRQAFTSYQVRAFHNQSKWTQRVASTFDAPPYFEMQRRANNEPGRSWGGDVYEVEPPYVSIVGTSDGTNVTGWYNQEDANQCQYGNAWVSYDPDNIPRSPGGGEVIWSDELATPIAGVVDPAANVCPATTGTALTRWTLYPQFEYASPSECTNEDSKRIDTIVSDHAPGDLSHHEVFYFTDVYGFSRWERWNCSEERSESPPDPDYAAPRCNYEKSPSVMHMAYADPIDPTAKWQIQNAAGLYCTLVDCRDTTFVEPEPEPGHVPAVWHPSAQVYYAGNLLLNGDFPWGDIDELLPPFWTAEVGMQPVVAADSDDNRYMLLDVGGDNGWFSQRTQLAEFYQTLGVGADEAGPLTIHYGALVSLVGAGSRQLQVALSQWDANNEQIELTIKVFDVTQEPQHIVATTPLEPGADSIQIRFRLSPEDAPAMRLDDAFVLVDDTP